MKMHMMFPCFSVFTLQIRNLVSTCLFENVDVRPRQSKQPRVYHRDRLHGGFKQHEMSFFSPSAVKRNPSRACFQKGRCSDTRYFFEDYDEALCACPCFHEYHSKQFYATRFKFFFMQHGLNLFITVSLEICSMSNSLDVAAHGILFVNIRLLQQMIKSVSALSK